MSDIKVTKTIAILGNSKALNYQYVYGTTGDDVIYGGFGDDKLYGADGNDTLRGGNGNGNDVVEGGMII